MVRSSSPWPAVGFRLWQQVDANRRDRQRPHHPREKRADGAHDERRQRHGRAADGCEAGSQARKQHDDGGLASGVPVGLDVFERRRVERQRAHEAPCESDRRSAAEGSECGHGDPHPMEQHRTCHSGHAHNGRAGEVGYFPWPGNNPHGERPFSGEDRRTKTCTSSRNMLIFPGRSLPVGAPFRRPRNPWRPPAGMTV